MAKVISFLSMQGGSGKTLTSIGLAKALVKYKNKKILFIDLGLDASATNILFLDNSDSGIDSKETVYCMFESMVKPNVSFDIKTSVKNINFVVGSDLKEGALLDILCSSADMNYGQDAIIRPVPIDRCQLPHKYLEKALDSLKKDYDFIIIDCLSSFNLITENVLAITDYCIIPTRYNNLGLNSAKLLIDNINEFSKSIDRNIIVLGLLMTNLDDKFISQDCDDNIHIFNTKFRGNMYMVEKNEVKEYKVESNNEKNYFFKKLIKWVEKYFDVNGEEVINEVKAETEKELFENLATEVLICIEKREGEF